MRQVFLPDLAGRNGQRRSSHRMGHGMQHLGDEAAVACSEELLHLRRVVADQRGRNPESMPQGAAQLAHLVASRQYRRPGSMKRACSSWPKKPVNAALLSSRQPEASKGSVSSGRCGGKTRRIQTAAIRAGSQTAPSGRMSTDRLSERPRAMPILILPGNRSVSSRLEHRPARRSAAATRSMV